MPAISVRLSGLLVLGQVKFKDVVLTVDVSLQSLRVELD